MKVKAGEIVELDTPANIYHGAKHEYTRTLLSSFPSLTGDRGGFLRTGVETTGATR